MDEERSGKTLDFFYRVPKLDCFSSSSSPPSRPSAEYPFCVVFRVKRGVNQPFRLRSHDKNKEGEMEGLSTGSQRLEITKRVDCSDWGV